MSRRYLLLQYNIIEEAATLQLWWVAHIVVRDLVVTLVGAGWWEWLLYSDMSPYKAKVRVCTRGCTMAREVGAAQSILPGRDSMHVLSRGCGCAVGPATCCGVADVHVVFAFAFAVVVPPEHS